MNLKFLETIFFTTALWTGILGVAGATDGAPKIQFEQTVYDFGKTSRVETVSGVFKFKNVGDGVLKLGPAQPSCGCTVAEIKPDTLKPGEEGELGFTLSLGRFRANLEKHITVTSNDPLTPNLPLIIKVDYTPLYELSPPTLTPILPFGANETEQFATLTRTDGKPLRLVRLDASKPWITAKLDPEGKADDASSRIRVTVQRNRAPGRFNESIQVYSADQTNAPISTVYLYGQIMGEISLIPDALYWSVTSSTQKPSDRAEAAVLRRVAIRSANGQPFELKNPQSTIPGIHVEIVSKESGKAYELVAKLNEPPLQTLSGHVSFETSVASQLKIEVPVIVNVLKQ